MAMGQLDHRAHKVIYYHEIYVGYGMQILAESY